MNYRRRWQILLAWRKIAGVGVLFIFDRRRIMRRRWKVFLCWWLIAWFLHMFYQMLPLGWKIFFCWWQVGIRQVILIFFRSIY